MYFCSVTVNFVLWESTTIKMQLKILIKLVYPHNTELHLLHSTVNLPVYNYELHYTLRGQSFYLNRKLLYICNYVFLINVSSNVTDIKNRKQSLAKNTNNKKHYYRLFSASGHIYWTNQGHWYWLRTKTINSIYTVPCKQHGCPSSVSSCFKLSPDRKLSHLTIWC